MSKHNTRKKISVVCQKCGKPAAVDKKKSTPNWTVYKMECECGGRCAVRITKEGMEQ